MIIIPARKGSVRFPNKLMHPVNGEPAIVHTISGCYGHGGVYVATDDEQIADVADERDAIPILTGECPTGTHRVFEASRSFMQEPKWVINVQGDCLLMKRWLIPLIENQLQQGKEIVTLVYDSPDDGVQVTIEDGKCVEFERTPYWGIDGLKHIGVYGYRYDVLKKICDLEPDPDLEQRPWLEAGIEITAVPTPFQMWRHLDVPEDVPVIEALLRKTEIQ